MRRRIHRLTRLTRERLPLYVIRTLYTPTYHHTHTLSTDERELSFLMSRPATNLGLTWPFVIEHPIFCKSVVVAKFLLVR